MSKDEFAALVAHWSQAWDAAKAANEDGFGGESTLEDWLGSIEAFAALRELADPAWIAPIPAPFPYDVVGPRSGAVAGEHITNDWNRHVLKDFGA